MNLLKKRIDALQEVEPGAVGTRLEDFQSGTTATPETPKKILGLGRHINEPLNDAFNKASDEFTEKSINLGLSCASQFRQRQREAHANPAYDPWPNDIRFFFTGGGSRLDFYRKLFVEGVFEQRLTSFTRWHLEAEERRRHGQGLRRGFLPRPDKLVGFPDDLEEDFDRLSVAYGLACGKENLMRITAQE